MTLNYPKKQNGMYLLRSSDFDNIATDFLKEYAPQNLQRPMPLDIDYIITDCLYITVMYRHLTYEGTVLGMVAFGDVEVPCLDDMYRPDTLEIDEGTMIVDASLVGWNNLPRNRFTKAHEGSHWILHRSYHSPTHQNYDLRTARNNYIACRSANIEKFSYGNRERTETEWEEWQADRLAASLLMPRDTFKEAARDAFRHNDINRGFLVKDQRVHDSINAVEEIADRFMVSKAATQIRLREMGMLYMSESEAYGHYYM